MMPPYALYASFLLVLSTPVLLHQKYIWQSSVEATISWEFPQYILSKFKYKQSYRGLKKKELSKVSMLVYFKHGKYCIIHSVHF
jgi:hypothetical protein